MYRTIPTGVFMLALTLTAPALLTAQTPDPDAIRDRLAKYAQARAQGDGATQAAFYTEDADTWLSTTRQMSRGPAEISKELQLPPSETRKFRLTVENVSFVASDVAVVDTEYFGQAATPNGHAVYVMVKRGGIWLIRSARVARYPDASTR